MQSARTLDLTGWIGRSEQSEDVVTKAPLRGLEALLDQDIGLDSGLAPPLAHWLYFLPTAWQSALDRDGHPVRGGFLPPVDLPRRMWAGGKLVFHAPLMIGSNITKRSTITRIEEKTGESGDLVFVTVAHEISCAGRLLVEEWQDIVYRGDTISSPAAARSLARSLPGEPRKADAVRRVCPSTPLLFRYSALTFNSHRIHFDRDYARDVEGYPGLVVHGPLQATLMMTMFAAQNVGSACSFEFRARKPLFDRDPFNLCLAWAADGADLWTVGPDGEQAISARVGTARVAA